MKKLIHNHILMSGIYKGISGMSLFLSIRILMDYLGVDVFGIWTLIFTVFQFVLLMDFGIQSTLKTKIPQLKINFDSVNILGYIKSTYLFSSIISLLIFIFFIVFSFFINFREIFNISNFSNNFIRNLFIINVFFFCINFVANIHKSLFVAFLKGKFSEASIALNQLVFFLSIFLFTKLNYTFSDEDKILYISLLNGS
ncbi:hypothetical protein, partial [Flavobacterium sp. 9AF]|uniref:hypothetical protein n=1 Tax=Flavobacterium sp. 9AF TaxID=2653142 RepID=UPI001F2C3585